MMEKIYLGTSGWSYDHWEDIFYPRGLSTSERLDFYIRHFNSVEVNYTFYRIPSEKSIIQWKESTPDYFKIALKANRKITHLRDRSSRYLSHLFAKRAKLLEEKLGVILYQWPPEFEPSQNHISDLLDLLPKETRVAVEFRNPLWHKRETLEFLKEKGIGYCIMSAPGFEPIFEATTKFIYFRLHGSQLWYSSSYKDRELNLFAERIIGFWRAGLDIFIYFNNDQHGYAVKNALKLKEILEKGDASIFLNITLF